MVLQAIACKTIYLTGFGMVATKTRIIRRMMVDLTFEVIFNSKSFQTAVTPTAVAPTAVILWYFEKMLWDFGKIHWNFWQILWFLTKHSGTLGKYSGIEIYLIQWNLGQKGWYFGKQL